MDKVKKHSVVVIIVLSLLVITSFAFRNYRNNNTTLADLGVTPLLKSDCSSVLNTNVTSPVSVSFNAPHVSILHDKIKLLIAKYNGHITGDSLNSYPSLDPKTPSQYNANITVTFDKSQTDFLNELSSTVKSSGGVDTNYNYTDSTSATSAYSSYSTCITMMRYIQTDMLQLSLFMKSLKEEHNSQNISFLSQSIYTVQGTLQNDINNINNFFSTSTKPSVDIFVGSLPAPIPYPVSEVNNN